MYLVAAAAEAPTGPGGVETPTAAASGAWPGAAAPCCACCPGAAGEGAADPGCCPMVKTLATLSVLPQAMWSSLSASQSRWQRAPGATPLPRSKNRMTRWVVVSKTWTPLELAQATSGPDQTIRVIGPSLPCLTS